MSEQDDPFDLVFLGSSRIEWGVIPQLVEDEVFSRAGARLRTFNAARAGVSTLQVERGLNRLLASSACPSVLVIELSEFVAEIPEVNLRTSRMIATHDFHALPLAFSGVWNADRPWWERLGFLGQRLEHFGLNYFRVGGISQVLSATRPGQEWSATRQGTLAEYQGYRSFEIAMAQATSRHILLNGKAKFAQSSSWEETLGQWRELVNTPLGLRRGLGLNALRLRNERILSKGVRPVFLVPPQRAPSPVLVEEARLAGLRTVINLNDPVRYPELVDRRHRYDVSHMNHAGAELLSRELGRLLTSILNVANR